MSGVVYVIGQPGAGLVKIGRSTNLQGRLSAIQTGCPNRVEVLWQVEGGSHLERDLHFEFRRFRTHGEWFDFGNADPVAFVREAVERREQSPRRSEPGNTPIRNVRVPDVLWNTAMAKARAEGKTLTNVIIRFLESYNAMTPAERRRAAGLDTPAERASVDPDEIPPADARRLAEVAVRSNEEGWAEAVLAKHPGAPASQHAHLLVAAALADGSLKLTRVPR